MLWKVAPKPGYRPLDVIRNNALSFAMVLGLGILILTWLLLTAGVSAAGSFLGSESVWHLADFGLSFGLVTLLFACIFKIPPDVHIPWRDVWPGAILTALLFTVAQVALSVIIRFANLGLAFGIAGGLVVILVWGGLASLILLFGAEFTNVYVMRFGSRVKPKAYAEALTKEAKALQGIPEKVSTTGFYIHQRSRTPSRLTSQPSTPADRPARVKRITIKIPIGMR